MQQVSGGVISTHLALLCSRLRLKCDGIRAKTRFRLSAKRTSPFKSVGASVQSNTGRRGVRISCSNAGYNTFRGSVKSTGYQHHSTVSLHFLPTPPRASPCAITFQLRSSITRSQIVEVTVVGLRRCNNTLYRLQSPS